MPQPLITEVSMARRIESCSGMKEAFLSVGISVSIPDLVLCCELDADLNKSVP